MAFAGGFEAPDPYHAHFYAPQPQFFYAAPQAAPVPQAAAGKPMLPQKQTQPSNVPGN
jgi:hypothetical protein